MIGSRAEAFESLVRRIAPGGKLLGTWKLPGGVSAEVTAFEIERADGGIEKLIVRRHGVAEVKRNPQIATDEFRLLRLLKSAGVPAPAPRYLDQGGELFATPSLVVEYVEGEPGPAGVDESTFVEQFAELLTEIHGIDRTAADLSFLPERKLADVPARRADESSAERRIREVLRSSAPPALRNRSVLLHGDFWPGNTLWHDGRLVAVVDWEDAAVGDPLADVANARLELLWAFGIAAMHDFTRRYEAMVARHSWPRRSNDCLPESNRANTPYENMCS